MAWPLNPLMRANYSITDIPPLRRTQMDSGPDRVVRISQSYLTNVSGAVFLRAEPDDQATWRAFKNGEANLGQAWFDMPIITDGAHLPHLVRLVRWGPITPLGYGWNLPITIETRDHYA